MSFEGSSSGFDHDLTMYVELFCILCFEILSLIDFLVYFTYQTLPPCCCFLTSFAFSERQSWLTMNTAWAYLAFDASDNTHHQEPLQCQTRMHHLEAPLSLPCPDLLR